MSRLASLARAARGRPRRTVAAGAAVLVVAALVTTAAFTDRAWLGLGTGSGLGTPASLQLEVKSQNTRDLSDDGTWIRVPEEGAGPVNPAPGTGGTVPIPKNGTLRPGGESATVDIPVRNASPSLDATLELRVLSRTDLDDPTPSAFAVHADGTPATVGESNAAYLDELLFDVLVDDVLVADDLPVEELPISLGALPAGAARLLTLEVRLPADGDLRLANGGTASLTAHLVATT